MAHNDSLNLQLPQQSERPLTECDQVPETTSSHGTRKAVAGLPVLGDHRLYFQTLREMLKSDKYQVALVPRGRWELIQGSRAEKSPPAASVVLVPFRWTELVAHLHEFAGESGALLERKIAQFGHVRVDLAKMEVSRSSGEPITLTIQEFKTLKCFLLNPDRTLSRDELLNEAWGYKNYPSTRTVDNHVLRLRQKLESDPSHPVHFLTIHRVGYKFAPKWPESGHFVE
jgi:DNA-binding winged helix-turn-helix (wHTH) protein